MSKVYEGTIKLPNCPTEKVTVSASSSFTAKAMLEAQYGKGNVIGNPVQR